MSDALSERVGSVAPQQSVQVSGGAQAPEGRQRAAELLARYFATYVRSMATRLDYEPWRPQMQVCAPFEVPAVVRALGRLRKFGTWSYNWDAEGAPAPDKDALESASQLLGYLKSFPIEPVAMLNSLGQPFLLFKYGDQEGEITVESGETIDFVFEDSSGAIVSGEGVEFQPTRLPQELKAALEKVTRADP